MRALVACGRHAEVLQDPQKNHQVDRRAFTDVSWPFFAQGAATGRIPRSNATDHFPGTAVPPSRAGTVILPPHARAQSFQGGVRGTLQDAQGVIPGVTVELINVATGQTRDSDERNRTASFPPRSTRHLAQVQGFAHENAKVIIGTHSSSRSTSAGGGVDRREHMRYGSTPLIDKRRVAGRHARRVRLQELSEGRAFSSCSADPQSSPARALQPRRINRGCSSGRRRRPIDNFLSMISHDAPEPSSINPHGRWDAGPSPHLRRRNGRTGGGVMNTAAAPAEQTLPTGHDLQTRSPGALLIPN